MIRIDGTRLLLPVNIIFTTFHHFISEFFQTLAPPRLRLTHKHTRQNLRLKLKFKLMRTPGAFILSLVELAIVICQCVFLFGIHLRIPDWRLYVPSRCFFVLKRSRKLILLEPLIATQLLILAAIESDTLLNSCSLTDDLQ